MFLLLQEPGNPTTTTTNLHAWLRAMVTPLGVDPSALLSLGTGVNEVGAGILEFFGHSGSDCSPALCEERPLDLQHSPLYVSSHQILDCEGPWAVIDQSSCDNRSYSSRPTTIWTSEQNTTFCHEEHISASYNNFIECFRMYT